MNTFMHLIGSVSLVLVLLCGAYATFPKTFRDLGLDPRELSAALKEIEKQRLLSQERTQLMARLRGQIRAKDKIGRELLEGRITLLEAAARYRDIPSDYWPGCLARVGGDTVDEKYCWYAFLYAEDMYRTKEVVSPAADSVLAQLKFELNQLKKHGELKLPRRD